MNLKLFVQQVDRNLKRDSPKNLSYRPFEFKEVLKPF